VAGGVADPDETDSGEQRLFLQVFMGIVQNGHQCSPEKDEERGMQRRKIIISIQFTRAVHTTYVAIFLHLILKK
jgi:hypothetical protein